MSQTENGVSASSSSLNGPRTPPRRPSTNDTSPTSVRSRKARQPNGADRRRTRTASAKPQPRLSQKTYYKRRVGVAISAALFAGSINLGYQHANGTPRRAWLDRIVNVVDHNIPLWNGNFRNNRDPRPACAEPPRNVKVPDYVRAQELVRTMEFVENNTAVIDVIVKKIERADTVKDAERIVQEFLSDRGIDSVFYRKGGNAQRTTLGGAHIYTYDTPSQTWNVSDGTRREALGYFVRSISLFPSALFDDWGDTVLAIPDKFTDHGGLFYPPTRVTHEKFVVSIPLSNYEHGMSIDPIIHELGHRDHAKICGIDGYMHDPQMLDIDHRGEYGIPEGFDTEYGRDGGIAESYATAQEGLFRYSLSSPASPRGSSTLREKQLLVLQRITALHSITEEEFLALVEVIRMNGIERHPRDVIKEGISPVYDYSYASIPPRDGRQMELIATPEGFIPIFCDGDLASETDVYCKTGITGALVMPGNQPRYVTGESDAEWFDQTVEEINAATMRDPSSLQPFQLYARAVSAGNIDPSFPQNARAELEVEIYRP